MKETEKVDIFKAHLIKDKLLKNRNEFYKKLEYKSLNIKEVEFFYQLLLKSGIIKSLSKLLSKVAYLYTKAITTEHFDAQQQGDETFNKELINYVFKEYPVLERLLNIEIKNWIENFIQLIIKFSSDKKPLNFNPVLSDIKSIVFGKGDKHREGKSVAIITLSNNKKIVYKPRNCSIDKNFENLLGELNTKINFDFKYPKTINYSSHGWSEFIEYKALQKEENAHLFYKRFGGLAALLYVFEATDFHYENIIAHGSHPVLIDLESFFHPYIPIQGTETNQGLDRSVLRTGILPNSFSIENSKFDIGGVADVANTKSLIARQEFKLNKNGSVD